MTLVVKPKYYDFFSRVLMPTQHYWPVHDDRKCSSIKHAVDWGNSHKKKVFMQHYLPDNNDHKWFSYELKCICILVEIIIQ
jgi:hypothetical protein